MLSGTINTTLRAAYEQAPERSGPGRGAPRHRTTARSTECSSVARRGCTVNEHGEYTRGTMTDSKESYQIAKYGRCCRHPRGDCQRLPGCVQPDPRRWPCRSFLELDIVYKGCSLMRPWLMDDVVSCHAWQCLAPAAISVASIGEVSRLMAVQTDDNGTAMNIWSAICWFLPAPRSPISSSMVRHPTQSTRRVPAYMTGSSDHRAPPATGVTIDGITTSRRHQWLVYDWPIPAQYRHG